MTTTAQELAKHRRRRGVAKGSITRIEARLASLEGETINPSTRDTARQMLAKLKENDAEFRKLHLAIVDLTEGDEPLEAEQVTLDTHDDLVASLTIRLMALIESTNPAPSPRIEGRELLARKCTRLETRLALHYPL